MGFLFGLTLILSASFIPINAENPGVLGYIKVGLILTGAIISFRFLRERF